MEEKEKKVIEKYIKQREWVLENDVGEKELFAFLDTYCEVIKIKENK